MLALLAGWLSLGVACRGNAPGGAGSGQAGAGTAQVVATAWPEARAAAERELAGQLDRLRKTGAATAELQKSFDAALAAWRGGLGATLHARFADEQCFLGGCTFAMTFSNTVPYEAIDAALLKDEAFRAWPGGKFRSGVFPQDAQTTRVVWVLFRDTSPGGAATQ